MNNISVTNTLNRFTPERIRSADDIHDSIITHADVIELDEKEKNLIDERLAIFRANPKRTASWYDVKRRILSRIENPQNDFPFHR